MKNKRAISLILSAVFGVVGIVFVYNFFSIGNKSVLDFVIGSCLLFLAIFNLYLTIKFSKN